MEGEGLAVPRLQAECKRAGGWSTFSIVHIRLIPWFQYVAPSPTELSLALEKNKTSFSCQGCLLLRSGNLTTSKNELSTNPPHLILSAAPSPTSSRQYLSLSCGSRVQRVGFSLSLPLNHQLSHPSAFQVTKFCSYCLLFSSSFPSGLETFKNHFRIVLWGIGKELEGFIFHLCTEILKSLLLFIYFLWNPRSEPMLGASAVSPP